ncbi:restriction endonuclease-like protein [Pontibacillus marinus]|uniref:DUF2357 domain-containing protein n=1 Tax=Pontibacillus marinus BH030004 = DSM 16465 TaxID=1385511 RepID=A0A0A5GI80_9BACI|nr:restriction endonuclease-like protein [Pontibacillus marinus]KGX91719.1 hypothetical protein N783_00120 [Pontibacillus marinus BH030004 = DSM 16465]
MDSRHSGWDNVDRNLVEIDTEKFTLVIKGKPYHHRYESLKQYKHINPEEKMYFVARGESVLTTKVYDVQEEQLMEGESFAPIFFENGVYQIIVSPKNDEKLQFYNEHPSLRKAVTRVQMPSNELLMGNLTFTNEVGYSTFSILEGENELLEVTMEVFPSKLSYKEDYHKLLEEVNQEVYNLAYHFIKKTYVGTKSTLTSESSWSEFYRLFSDYFDQFMRSLSQIESQPHHELKKEYRKVRGDQLRKQDSTGRRHLRKRPHLFHKVDNGIPVNGTPMMPAHGLNVHKQLSYNTLENRFVKWMMQRIIHKLHSLYSLLTDRKHPYQKEFDSEITQQVFKMKSQLEKKLGSTFWRQIGKLDRSVMSLVMQMAPGYREAYQTYLIVSRGLVLHGELSKMSLKDVATLYEYWTFLKLGSILSTKYKSVSQDIIQVNRQGLFVKLKESATAKRVFQHPQTDERITLHFQKLDRPLPTVAQKPDSMLSIEKKGKKHHYHYVFDAKYRIDFAADGSYYKREYGTTGPMEEDINTMHRYRDALVVQSNGPYERYAFGAYVLFPWNEEHEYEAHKFYQSINEVNIGGFPFLPKSTSLVERFIDRLIESTPEQLQEEGMLPRGALEEWTSSLEEKVLVVKVGSEEELEEAIKTKTLQVAQQDLKKDWHQAQYIAIYKPKQVFGKQGGIYQYASVGQVDIKESNGNMIVEFQLDIWKSLKQAVKPVNYGISNSIMTTLSNLKDANELPELFMKTDAHKQMWKMLRRFSKQIKVELDHSQLDGASSIKTMTSKDKQIIFELIGDEVKVNFPEHSEVFSIESFIRQPNTVFRELSKQLG